MSTQNPSSTLIARCKETAKVAADALSWIADPANTDTVGQDRKELERELRQHMLSARKLEGAVNRPMCVGVFGPSQAGKSYLVSVLARKGDSPLYAMFEGHPDGIDFISRINPEGDKESTGLVTRFTIRPGKHPPGYPVCLRLLSQVDLVKIVGNSFFFDGNLKDELVVTPEEIRKRLDAAHAARRPNIVDTLTQEDIWNIQEYFEKQFEGVEHMKALAGFWEDAAEIAPFLDAAARTELFSVLWGGHAPFSALYLTLVGALAQLGFADEAFCTLDALIPRDKSIIDVATLAGLGRDDPETLTIMAQSGAIAALPRPVITALVAELRIVMKEQAWPFFDHTDLLDFPGARSRQRRQLKTFFTEQSDALKELFLRGKVAYLFDRYVAEQELTSMLLCIKHSNQEVTSLPDMIDDWIGKTHGTTPAERLGKPIVLFFVLTMFDVHFVEKAGAEDGDPGNRFRARLYASLLNFFAQAHKWPLDWTPGQTFKNCFWLRNPNFPAESIIRYDGRREVQFLEEKRERIAELKAAYLKLDEVRKHFADPEKAWDEALKLNDGGIGHLADSLGPVCNPDLKRQQIASRLGSLRHGMRERLAAFHISEDLDTRLNERLAAADIVVDQLYQAADSCRFGHLVHALQVRASEMTDVLYRVQVAPPEPDVQIVSAAPDSGRRIRPTITRPGVTARAAAPVSARPRTITRERQLADEAIGFWISKLNQLAGSERAQRVLHMSAESLSELVAEIKSGARRVDLAEEIAEEIRRFSYIEKGDQILAKSAVLAARTINNFVGGLGYARTLVAARPQVKAHGISRPVFEPRPIRNDASGLAAEAKPFADDFITDWAFAFVAFLTENASSKDGQMIDVEQNARIGRLLATLSEAV